MTKRELYRLASRNLLLAADMMRIKSGKAKSEYWATYWAMEAIHYDELSKKMAAKNRCPRTHRAPMQGHLRNSLISSMKMGENEATGE